MRHDPKDRCKTLWRQDGRGRTVCDDPSVIQQNEPVAKPAGKAQVMNGGHGRQPILDYPLVNKLQQVQLMREIQARGWLIQQQQTWLLRQSPRDGHALPFASRQFRNGTVREGRDPGVSHRVCCDRVILGCLASKSIPVWIAPH